MENTELIRRPNLKFKFTGNNNKKCFESKVKDEFLEPIPLTEEWLLKFGFKIRDGEWWIDNEIFGVTFDENHEPLHIWDGSFTDSPCKYVHQLQNLYFALTGTELQCAL